MKKILHIIPYHTVFPPSNGGQLRCFHLMDQLANNYKIDVFSYQSAEDITNKGYSKNNINFYIPHSFPLKNQLWSILPTSLRNAFRYRWLRRSLKGPASATVLDFAHIVEVLSKKRKYDIVIYEHISSMLLSPIIKRFQPYAKTIIDAHNIDNKLLPQKKLKAHTRNIEEHFYKEVDSFWACSQEDLEELELMNNSRLLGTLVCNGVDTLNKPYHHNKVGLNKNLLFCGSLDYPPNKEGLIWFYEEIWPLIITQINDVKLTIIGRGDTTPYKHFENDLRINLVGEVDDVTTYYKKNYIAIVPLLSGSGTRLKILEAMSFGNPTVTTSIGIEGIKAENNKETLIADSPEAFANSVVKIIKSPELGETIRVNANQLIKATYDWKVIGEQLNKSLFND